MLDPSIIVSRGFLYYIMNERVIQVPAQTTDPRAIRTRQLIVDAFTQLIKMKNFGQISVKDITGLATINRATFYAHFVDKYDLLDVVLTEETSEVMKTYFTCQEPLSEDLMKRMFLSIVDIHHAFNTHCRRGYNTFTHMIEEKVKAQLERIFESLLEGHKLDAILLSWGMYGAYVEWDTNGTAPAEDYAQSVANKLLELVPR